MTTKIEDIILEAEREGGADFIPLISDGDDSFEFKEGENESSFWEKTPITTPFL